MKRLLFFTALFIAGTCFTSCQKESLKSTEGSNNSIKSAHPEIDKLDIVSQKFSQMAARNEVRLARLGIDASRECVQTAIVPDDYATIQEAVDAVCEYGNVIVKSGTYNEDAVVIYKDGISVKAAGNVTLNGGFGIEDYVKDVRIQKFKIDMTNAYYIVGIGGFFNNGCEIKQNTIYGSNHIGIYFRYCNNMSITKNTVSDGDIDYGIYIDAWFEGGMSCVNNKILNNTVIGINAQWAPGSWGTGIQLRGDCDNNIVQGNEVYSCLYGISLWLSYADYERCDHNIVKNNISNDNVYSGIEIGLGGSNNTIGPNNTANNNGDYGIIFWDETIENHTFNNTALNNTFFDIVNLGTDNSFKKNIAGSTYGVD